MVLSLRKLKRRLTFVVLFVFLTLAVSVGIRLLSDWLRMPDPYAAPQGHAVKVFGRQPDDRDGMPLADRLRWFYLTGE